MKRRNDIAIGLAVAWARYYRSPTIVTINGPTDLIRVFAWSRMRQSWRMSGLVDRGELVCQP